MFLACHYSKTALPVQMLTTTYVACAKHGQITNAFATKIINGVHDELGYEIQLDPETVRLLYQHFGKNLLSTVGKSC
jgi:hypothetical protein